MNNNQDIELEVRNLKVSFRTQKGLVQAVRNISFNVKKGETLAIVGESGSGKSVTAKAILGIEAPNAIIEDGEILYKGQNLLTFSEDEYNKIRGNKITMVFQDPMSSLDPIVKIGPQMTEATILNGKTNQKNAKQELNKRLIQLQKCLVQGGIPNERVKNNISTFRKFIHIGSKLKSDYNKSIEYARSIITDIENIDNSKTNFDTEKKHILKKINHLYNEYFLHHDDETIKTIINNNDLEETSLQSLKNFLQKKLEEESPNFFTLGYYIMTRKKDDLILSPSNKSMKEKNSLLREIIDKEFMTEFLNDIAHSIKIEWERCIESSKNANIQIQNTLPYFASEKWDIVACKKQAESLTKIVDNAEYKLNLHPNRAAYTLNHTLMHSIAKYEETPHAAKTMALNALNDLHDYYLSLTSQNDDTIVQEENFYKEKAIEIIDNIKELSEATVYHITKQMAYDKAIRIMEEVGIRDARKRFNQYPFEFSGGMRQRIVIAIAIAANPDLLICDEPTTALDVTIQAQILELINKLKNDRQMSVIFITHDLGVVANVADKIAVMYAGKIIEKGTAEDIFYSPAHPYTWALLASMPDLETKDKLEAIPGTPPNMIYPPKGDAFASRNKYAMAIDFEKEPPLFKISESHYAATWLLHPNAPKVEPPKIVKDRMRRNYEQ